MIGVRGNVYGNFFDSDSERKTETSFKKKSTKEKLFSYNPQ